MNKINTGKMRSQAIILLLAICLILLTGFQKSAMAQDKAAKLGNNQTGRVIELKDAQRMALKNNYNAKNLNEMVRQADLWSYKAYTILFPNLSADGSVTRNGPEASMAMPDLSDSTALQNAIVNGAPLPMIETPIVEKWSYSAGFTANMAIFNAESIPAILKAKDNIDFSRLDARHKKNELLFAVAAAYYQVHFSQEALRISQEDLKNAEEFYRLSKARLEVGEGIQIDVLRAESEKMRAEKQVANAEDSIKLAKLSLALLIGLKDYKDYNDYEVGSPVAAREIKADRNQLVRMALDDRLDLKAAYLNRKMAERDKLQVWMKWVPTFDVTYNWTYNSTEGFTGSNDSWRLIFGLKWNILDGGRKIIDLGLESSDIRIASNNLENLKLDIKEEVEKDKLEVETRKRNKKLAKKQLEVAEETYRQVSKQYEHGLATSLDQLTASTQLASIKLNYVMEKLQHQLAILKLNKSSGKYDKLLDSAR